MNEQTRRREIRSRLALMAGTGVSVIPSGFRALANALGGGFPRRSIVEIFGPPSCGKTTLMLQSVAAAQSSGFTAAWIDAEHVFDAAYASGLGVVLDRLPIVRPESAEQALEIAQRLALSGAVDLLVIDSAAALVPRLELQTGIGQSSSHLQSRVLASGLRKLAQAVAKADTSIVFLNQTRSSGEMETSAGGPPLKLCAQVRLALAPAGVRRTAVRVVKNKIAASPREGELSWQDGAGFTESP